MTCHHYSLDKIKRKYSPPPQKRALTSVLYISMLFLRSDIILSIDLNHPQGRHGFISLEL
jgi:hypothetical protein